jgi:hypothetical protein
MCVRACVSVRDYWLVQHLSLGAGVCCVYACAHMQVFVPCAEARVCVLARRVRACDYESVWMGRVVDVDGGASLGVAH